MFQQPHNEDSRSPFGCSISPCSAFSWKLNVLFLLALANSPDMTQAYRANFCIEAYVAVYCRSSILAGVFRLP